MAGSSFGTIFRITTFGESHGAAVGAVVDGCPAGLDLCEQDIQYWLNLRRPGSSRFTTPRKEADLVHILSGTFEGKTTGTPIMLLINNETARSKDYSEIAGYYRPGHADYTYDRKYGFRDYRGGGRSSGRETAGRVAAGAVAITLLARLGIDICCYVRSIGGIEIDESRFNREEILNNPLYMPDAAAAREAEKALDLAREKGDSLGGIIECRITGVPAGLGDPVFEKLSANLAKAVCSIGAVKGFEIGSGFAAAAARGSENNDPFRAGPQGPAKASNHAGGILGGISDGSEITFRAAVKPTPSISIPQQTVNKKGEEISVSIHGRHDPVIAPRAAVVVHAMTALVLADALLLNMTSRADYIADFYKNR